MKAVVNGSTARRIVGGLEQVRVEPTRRFRGRDFSWDHEVQIALPASYGKTTETYPVLWVTDGSMYFEWAVKTVNYDLRFHLPEMIIVAVGVPAAELTELDTRRSFEFLLESRWGFSGFGAELFELELYALNELRRAAGVTELRGGGAAQFLNFLVDELRPALSNDYRFADDHTLFGDSAGGYFCAHAFLARPDAFSRYICGSPTLHAADGVFFRMEEDYAKRHRDLKATIFFGAGEGEMQDPVGVVRTWGVVSSTARAVEILSSRNYPSLNLEARIFPGEDHSSVVSSNLSWGLRAVWSGRTPRHTITP